MVKRIYLDYAASTPVAPEVLGTMRPYFSEKFGNPGSLHAFGQEAIAAVDVARETIARAIGADFREIIFTGSATEANNLALRGAVKEFRIKNLEFGGSKKSLNPKSYILNPRLIVSSVEHESVLETVRDLEKEGAEVVYLPVDKFGAVDLRKLEESLNERTVLVSIIYVQNEIGTVEPIKKAAEIVIKHRGNGRYPTLHTDAAQAFQFFDCNVRELAVDLMTLSAQKIYGPKGVGALYTKNLEFRSQNLGINTSLYPKSYILNSIITGGGQEFGLRSGTENVPAIVGFAKAVELNAKLRESEGERIAKLRDYFWQGLKKICPEAEINGPEPGSPLAAPHIIDIHFPGYTADEILTKFDLKGLAVSSGSACSARSAAPSYVVKALGYSERRAKKGIRFSFGRPTTKDEIDAALKIIKISL